MVFIQILLLAVLLLVGFLSLFYFDHHSTTRRKLFAWINHHIALALPRRSEDKMHPAAEKDTMNSSVTTAAAAVTSSGDGDDGENRKRDGGGDEIRKVFQTFDKNGDGFITRQELGETLRKMGISTSEDEVRQMVERLDSSGDGLIDLNEFSGLFSNGLRIDRKDEGDEARRIMGVENDKESRGLKEAFDVFDGDGDGLISVEELGLVLCSLGLNEGKRVEICKEMIKKVDLDGDGMVNFDEFKRMMRSGGIFCVF